MVPTVERGLRFVDFWSMDTAGDRPSMKSTSGLSIWPRNCLAYADSDSTYRRWPSAKIVSKARLDLPDPDSPVNTIRASRGRSMETSLRLCSRAPRTTSRSATARSSLRHTVGGSTQRLAIVVGGSEITGLEAASAGLGLARSMTAGRGRHLIALREPPLCPVTGLLPHRASHRFQPTPAASTAASLMAARLTVAAIPGRPRL